MRTVAITNDWQLPFHDPLAIETMTRLCERVGIDEMILNGDIVDCYPISHFDKDPSLRSGLQREVDLAGAYLSDIRARLTRKITWLGGNHEERWIKLLWEKPALNDLKALAFTKVFPIDEMGVEWVPYGQWVDVGKLMVTHGHAYTATATRSNYAKYGQSVLVGHTHRLGTYYVTDRRGPHVSIENGCLCNLKPRWVQSPNWQQGFSIVTLHDNGDFLCQQIPIIKRHLAYYGSLRVDGRA